MRESNNWYKEKRSESHRKPTCMLCHKPRNAKWTQPGCALSAYKAMPLKPTKAYLIRPRLCFKIMVHCCASKPTVNLLPSQKDFFVIKSKKYLVEYKVKYWHFRFLLFYHVSSSECLFSILFIIVQYLHIK